MPTLDSRITGALVAFAILVVGALSYVDCNRCVAGPVSAVGWDGSRCVRGHVDLLGSQLVCQCPERR